MRIFFPVEIKGCEDNIPFPCQKTLFLFLLELTYIGKDDLINEEQI